ncbi:hypothetical protein NK8_35780 [Caballeronia sp. NK8]|uniref:hypothetical protein n=1 Tax=Caballeronia sp. NK8 TaxID=140098 RepID=UPI001BB6F44D|nr:hypothetical protein [Caballeronia sp. NK8]BCQ25401.1 hypothetical protein NK8_35780 [Caballeronia sp. NK8]
MATECMFSANYAINLSFAEDFKVSGMTPPSAGFESLDSYRQQATSSQTVKSECNTGNDGQALQAKTTSTQVKDATINVTFASGAPSLIAQAFPTTYTGLYYWVGIQRDGSTADPTDYQTCVQKLYGALPPLRLAEVVLADPGDANDKYCMDGKAWRFWVGLAASSEYRAPSSPAQFKSTINPHGNFRISGATGDKDQRIVTVQAVDIQGTVSA